MLGLVGLCTPTWPRCCWKMMELQESGAREFSRWADAGH